MVENPIFNPNPTTGVKGQNPMLNTAKYQIIKILRAFVKGFEIALAAIIVQVKDIIRVMAGR